MHQFCCVLAFTHQVEILWSGNRDLEQITDVTLISCPVPAAGAISTGGATGGVPAPHLREHVTFRHLNGALMPKGTHFTRLPFCQWHFWCGMCCWSQSYIIPPSKYEEKKRKKKVAYRGQALQGARKLAIQPTTGNHITWVAVLWVQRQILIVKLWNKRENNNYIIYSIIFMKNIRGVTVHVFVPNQTNLSWKQAMTVTV